MNQSFDCIVLGLGAMGSSSAYHLTKKKKKVLGIERFSCAHALGSSHGETRLIRKAYFEHPDYVPLLERSYELWFELEKRSSQKLLHQTGLVIFGDPQTSEILKGVQKSAQKYRIPMESWSEAEISKKFSIAKVPSHFKGLFEPTGGYLEVENCVRTHCKEAAKLGAQLQFEEQVVSWKRVENGFEVKTPRGTYWGEKLISTLGPWTADLLPALQSDLKVHRAPLFWFQSQGLLQKEKGVPCFAFDLPEGFFYGFTEIEGQFKVALHKPLGYVSRPEAESREVLLEEAEPVKHFVSRYFPKVSSSPQKSALCFYTLSPDSHFILDEHPQEPGFYFGAGFSGHGFKFSSLVGEVLADWVAEGQTQNPVDFLKWNRLEKKV